MATQGHAKAEASLGSIYVNGDGVPLDNKLAYMWREIAESGGDKRAKGNLVEMKKEMSLSDIKAAHRLAKECITKNYKGC